MNNFAAFGLNCFYVLNIFICIAWTSVNVDMPLSGAYNQKMATIDDFRGACAVKGNVQVAGRTSSVSTTEMLSTHDVTLRNVDRSLFHVQI